ncbi:uncharacterized protein LOC132563565 [Ylistrum balloti]|uniref:uncharacterized protein LOC132563565 n=1 Tax=Ylistrum balloti TaxID=509963 RepID=UPI002905BF49|nr:uncharacterized protein LOC132563565 [Ylistrum balloti]
MSRSQFDERILRGFILSSDALFEIRTLLNRRQKTKFSEGLSPEARLALQQMTEDTRVKFNEDSDDNSAGEEGAQNSGRKNVQISRISSRRSGRDKSRRQISFTDSPRVINKEVKSFISKKEVINTKEINITQTTGEKHVGDHDLLTTEPNPVDKCREWVAENGIETSVGR